MKETLWASSYLLGSRLRILGESSPFSDESRSEYAFRTINLHES